MGLRILTGVLVPEPGKETAGQAVVEFNPHQVTGDADGENLTEWGESGDFDAPPSAVVSIKRVTIVDRGWLDFDFTFGPDLEVFNVSEDPPSTDRMEVEWSTAAGAQINAISYMVVGEA